MTTLNNRSLNKIYTGEFMKTIILDVDDVICTNHFVPIINMYLNSNYTEDDFNSIKFEIELFPNEDDRNKFYDFFISVDSYKYSQLKPNAYNIIKKLVKNNRVILLTSAIHYERSLDLGRQFTDKFKFLLNKLPFFPVENIIFANQKDLIKADIIIDDRVQNLNGDYKHKFLFTCFHNKKISDEELFKQNIVRVNDWSHLYKMLNSIDVY